MKDYSLAGNFEPVRFNEEFLAKLGRVFTPDVQLTLLKMRHGAAPVELAGVIVLSDLFKGRAVTVEYGDFSHTFTGEGFSDVFKQFIKCSEVQNGSVAQ